MKKLVSISVLAFVGTAGVSQAQFAVDLSAAEVRMKTSSPAVIDLAVGEVGLLNYPNFCSQNGVLYLDAQAPLATEAMEFGITYRVKRQPGGGIAVTAEAGAKAGRPPETDFIRGFARERPCSPPYFTSIIPVTSFQGYETLSEVMEKSRP